MDKPNILDMANTSSELNISILITAKSISGKKKSGREVEKEKQNICFSGKEMKIILL